jgi:hypothetical protein
MERLGVISLFISLILLFTFIIFIKNTRKKILDLSEELQDFSTQLEISINNVIKEINDGNKIIVNRLNTNN